MLICTESRTPRGVFVSGRAHSPGPQGGNAMYREPFASNVMLAGRPHRRRGEPVSKGLDCSRRSPQAARFPDGERLCIVKDNPTSDGRRMADGRGYSGIVETAELALGVYLAEAAFCLFGRRLFH